jgi:hypothetical protein
MVDVFLATSFWDISLTGTRSAVHAKRGRSHSWLASLLCLPLASNTMQAKRKLPELGNFYFALKDAIAWLNAWYLLMRSPCA